MKFKIPFRTKEKAASPSESTPLVAGDANGQDDQGTWRSLANNVGKNALITVMVLLLMAVAFSYEESLAGHTPNFLLFSAKVEPDEEKSQKHVRSSTTTTDGNTGDDVYATKIDDTESSPKYINTQFISFTINTIGGIADKGECKGQPVDPNNGFCYLGNRKNITEDISHRLEIVDQVLQRIKRDASAKSPDIDHRDDVLKIVMIPEFFWRGPNGAYSTDLLKTSVVSDLTERLREKVRDDFFNDFLFVFGTFIAADTPNDPRKPWELTSAQSVEYFNFASVQKGGSKHQHRYLVTKRYISTVDFLSRTTLPNPTEENKNLYGELPDAILDFIKKRNVTLITNNILELDGLRIGLEICLDHRRGTLWDTIKAHQLPLVDILLVTSAGMSIERGPNPVVPGGAVYLCDGEASSAACLRTDNHEFSPDSVCRGEVGGLKHVPVGGLGYV